MAGSQAYYVDVSRPYATVCCSLSIHIHPSLSVCWSADVYVYVMLCVATRSCGPK